uniref:E3 ubiquitin ligase UBR4 C-terminal domain-containing protein n=1 Tax=Ciona savignyi TaxID=51511 RepID=H2YSY4_CIOSA
MLTGLCTNHTLTQELVGETAIPGLHSLEQVSTAEGIGSLSENVLEALQEHPQVAKEIKKVRRETRGEKKKRAMAVRQKQLGALGMHTNDKGQVISKSSILQQITELVEESGLTCIICREGYKFEPKKVLGIYTYTQRCLLEEFENSSRKQQGYSTVSHFNVVHFDCHTAAVRMARGREEWDSALLQNASTKCNGLLPLWGSHVPESAFASCLARHNTYIQEATGHREYAVYKPYMLFWALVDLIVTVQFSHVPDDVSLSLAEYIRHNDTQLLETGEKMLQKFQDEYLVCESLAEFVDVAELHDVTGPDVTAFLENLFNSIPS